MSVLTLILAGGAGFGLGILTRQRSKPAIPFGGKYRIIDFPLSNVVNSYLSRVAVLTQFHPHSLIEHLGTGEPWGLHQSPQGGIQIWQPYRGRTDEDAYTGTANAVYQNRKFIAQDGSDTVLILSGDFLCKQDYRDLIHFHQAKGADFTISAMVVTPEQTREFGMMQVDENQRILKFEEKPEKTAFTIASMGQYVFNTSYMLRHLEEDAKDPDSHHDFGRSILPKMVAEGRGYAYPFSGYWHHIGSIQAYYENSLALLDPDPALDLYDPDWVFHTRSSEKPPVKVRQPAQIINSLVSDGCIIDGEVIHSILSPGVRVEKGAVVRDSVIFNDAVIHSGAAVTACVVDKSVEVGANAHIGPIEREPGLSPHLISGAITVIGKGTRIPAGSTIGQRCQVEPNAVENDFPGPNIADGSTIRPKESE